MWYICFSLFHFPIHHCKPNGTTTMPNCTMSSHGFTLFCRILKQRNFETGSIISHIFYIHRPHKLCFLLQRHKLLYELHVAEIYSEPDVTARLNKLQ